LNDSCVTHHQHHHCGYDCIGATAFREAKKSGLWSDSQRNVRNNQAKDQRKSDSRLLYDARQMKKGQKLSKDQYAALKRKVGGTARDYFKDWVDVDGPHSCTFVSDCFFVFHVFPWRSPGLSQP
jgi:hypothetical protein